MRSYGYKEGTWETCQDRLPPSEYWKLHQYHGAYKIIETYKAALKAIGFNENRSTYSCLIGSLSVHARNHEHLSRERGEREIDFDFLCVIAIGGTYVRVWIPDLPNLLLFLREVDAKISEESAEEAIKDFLSGGALTSFLENTALAMEYLSNDNICITIEQKEKQPPKRR